MFIFTISFAVNSQFIATSTFVVNLRKHEIVKFQLVFVPFVNFASARHRIANQKFIEIFDRNAEFHFFFFNSGRTSKNQIVKKPFVFIAFSFQKVRFCIDKNAIDTTALYSLEFRKRYKKQCFFFFLAIFLRNR